MRQTIYRDPVCGKRLNRNKAHIVIHYGGWAYFLCCPRCQREFEAGPRRYARPELGQKIAKGASSRLKTPKGVSS